MTTLVVWRDVAAGAHYCGSARAPPPPPLTSAYMETIADRDRSASTARESPRSSDAPTSLRLFGALRFLYEDFQARAAQQLPHLAVAKQDGQVTGASQTLETRARLELPVWSSSPRCAAPAGAAAGEADSTCLVALPPALPRRPETVGGGCGVGTSSDAVARARASCGCFTVELLKLRDKKKLFEESSKQHQRRSGASPTAALRLGGSGCEYSAAPTARSCSRDHGSRALAAERNRLEANLVRQSANGRYGFGSLTASLRWPGGCGGGGKEDPADRPGGKPPKFIGVVVPSHTDCECPHCQLYTEEWADASPPVPPEANGGGDATASTANGIAGSSRKTTGRRRRGHGGVEKTSSRSSANSEARNRDRSEEAMHAVHDSVTTDGGGNLGANYECPPQVYESGRSTPKSGVPTPPTDQSDDGQRPAGDDGCATLLPHVSTSGDRSRAKLELLCEAPHCGRMTATANLADDVGDRTATRGGAVQSRTHAATAAAAATDDTATATATDDTTAQSSRRASDKKAASEAASRFSNGVVENGRDAGRREPGDETAPGRVAYKLRYSKGVAPLRSPLYGSLALG